MKQGGVMSRSHTNRQTVVHQKTIKESFHHSHDPKLHSILFLVTWNLWRDICIIKSQLLLISIGPPIGATMSTAA